MCNFFSFVVDKNNNKYYFDWNQRKQLLLNNPEGYSPDSHTSICSFYKLDEDKMNKYEYNPLTNNFCIDQENCKACFKLAKKWVQSLNFETIIEPLIVKPIINPLLVINNKEKFNNNDLSLLLKEWNSVKDSVRDSVRDSVWCSVRYSVGNSVGDSVGNSVWDSVWDSVRDSVWCSVRDSVEDSVWCSVKNSVRNSVRDSINAYISSFFILKKWYNFETLEPFTNPFQSIIILWENGFIPSFDGTTWRIYKGQNAEIVFSITKEELDLVKI